MDILKPSLEIWKWYKGDISDKLIISSIADKIAGYHISYSATELLRDLGLLTSEGQINKKAKMILAHQLHEKYHRKSDNIVIIDPTKLSSNVEIDDGGKQSWN